MASIDLDRIRRDLENFAVETGTEWYMNWSGRKEDLQVSVIYDKYAHLFTRENIAAVKLRRNTSGEEDRRLRYLQQFLTDEYLSMAVKDLTDKSETVQASEKITVEGEEIPFRFAAVEIANEEKRARRSMLYEARNRVIEDKVNPILEDRIGKLHSTAKELGYSNYQTLYMDIKAIDFAQLELLMRKFIAETETLYKDKMSTMLKNKIGVELEEAEKHDIALVFRAKEFDKHFKKENMVNIFRRTLAGMGIRLEQQKNVELDIEERPKKMPRAFCSPLKVPEDVKLVIMPIGGHDDYAALFHEGGHAEHFASVNPSTEVEYKRLGDNSVTESFAFLFEYLTQNEKWLKQYIGIKAVENYLEFATLYTLYFVRSYGAKIAYENRLHTSQTLHDLGGVYKKTMEEVLKFKHPPSHYLITVDDAFYCAQYLQAWIFEAQMRSRFVEKYGEEWFNNPETGRFLKTLWAHGQKYNVIELARQLGFAGLDIKPLLTNIKERLG